MKSEAEDIEMLAVAILTEARDEAEQMQAEAKEKAENIRREIEKITFHSIPDLKVTVSIGVSSNFEGSTYRDLLKNADLALYKAKKTGRNKVVAFSELEEHVRTLT